MRKLFFVVVFISTVISLQAQYIYPVAEYSAELKDVELSNFDIKGDVLYLPLGISGLHLLNIEDYNNITELSVYNEYEKRSREKVYGIAHCVNVIDNTAYLSYGPLGLKVLDVSDPTMPFVIGTYYRHEDVYCSEIYENYALLGYLDMGLEIIDLSNLNDIKMISRNNERDYPVQNIEILPPYVVMSGLNRGIRTFKFREPFTSFKQAEFPRKYLPEGISNEIEVRGTVGYIANDTRGISVVSMGLPLYPLEVNSLKTEGSAKDILIEGNYMYVACDRYIEVYDIKEPEKPTKIFEHEDKTKDFERLKIVDNHLFALYGDGRRGYGFVIFQVE